jgi:hypothetical protein
VSSPAFGPRRAAAFALPDASLGAETLSEKLAPVLRHAASPAAYLERQLLVRDRLPLAVDDLDLERLRHVGDRVGLLRVASHVTQDPRPAAAVDARRQAEDEVEQVRVAVKDASVVHWSTSSGADVSAGSATVARTTLSSGVAHGRSSVTQATTRRLMSSGGLGEKIVVHCSGVIVPCDARMPEWTSSLYRSTTALAAQSRCVSQSPTRTGAGSVSHS